ncbi:DUF5689 domain-containing protein [Desulfurobacterium atlanticum]|uniref:C terminal of Calcineurin-like phosphoesterase n=1 Tax=Desulfurobacterium atlanticum TaxID=240169 RepID=A0A238ZMJ5_9BACT|nr:DUF5689 domain-containing protein [Desulfurobacterium atlanticum]SNR83924.1 C terminal of Calcineurin-like phosphoesterase [Desulfurobacterium atlanticum]
MAVFKKSRLLLVVLSASCLLAGAGCSNGVNNEANNETKYGEAFFTHFADIHLTNDTEVADVFGGTIPPVTTMKKAVAEVLSMEPEVVVDTGDIVALADSHDLDTDERWFKLVESTIYNPIVDSGIPFLFAPGNHDQAGIKVNDIDKDDPRYGNGLIFEYIDKDKDTTYYSYDKGNYHFVMLDPEEIPETGYRAVRLPQEQLDWLKEDLEANKDKFIIIAYHQPLGSWEDESYSAFMDIIKPYKGHIAIVAGHTHDNRVIYRDGIPEYQDGAPCGDWWQTGKTPDGNPIGYAVYYIKDGEINRFYKGIGKTKQINLLNPVDVVINEPVAAEFNVYYENKTVEDVCYTIDNGTPVCFDVKPVVTPKITWYHVTGTITPTVIDNRNHDVEISVRTSDGEFYNRTIVYKFSDNPEMKISEITDDTNFEYYYGRFVTVNATVVTTAYDGNLLTIKDDTGSIVVWAGDCHHPEFSPGDMIKMRAQVTQFRGTKELKLVSADDVTIYGHQDIASQVTVLNSIAEAYEDYDSLENTIVQATGVVTAKFGNLVFIQDDSEGIAVWLGEASEVADKLSVGSNVTVSGELTKYNGMVEIVPVNADNVTINGESEVPSPKEITLDEVMDNLGTLVKISNVTVSDVSSSSVTISDGANTLTIYDKAGLGISSLVNVGDVVNVTGVIGYYIDKPEIFPRTNSDIEIVSTSSENETVTDNTTSVIVLDSIKEAYDNYSELEGKDIQVSGVVTADFGNLIFVQDDTQGIAVYSNIPDDVTVGSLVTISGTLTSYSGMVEIKPDSETDFTITGEGDLPEPAEASIQNIESYAGMLVKLTNVTIENVSSSSVTVTDGVNTLTVYCGKAGFDPSTFVNAGDTIDVVGVVGYYNDTPQIYPTAETDIIVK